MSKAVEEWTDARLNALAAALEPVPIKVAALDEAVEHLDQVTMPLLALPAQVAVLTAAVERLAEENRELRVALADTRRELLQVACALVPALIGAAGALLAALI